MPASALGVLCHVRGACDGCLSRLARSLKSILKTFCRPKSGKSPNRKMNEQPGQHANMGRQRGSNPTDLCVWIAWFSPAVRKVQRQVLTGFRWVSHGRSYGQQEPFLYIYSPLPVGCTGGDKQAPSSALRNNAFHFEDRMLSLDLCSLNKDRRHSSHLGGGPRRFSCVCFFGAPKKATKRDPCVRVSWLLCGDRWSQDQ